MNRKEEYHYSSLERKNWKAWPDEGRDQLKQAEAPRFKEERRSLELGDAGGEGTPGELPMKLDPKT